MKNIKIKFLLIFFLTSLFGRVFSFPYSNSDEIILYEEESKHLLSSFAKGCLEKRAGNGLMSELSQRISCSNYKTAKDVCACVDSVFDKSLVETHLADDYEFNSLQEFFNPTVGSSYNQELQEVFMSIQKAYTSMGRDECKLTQNDPFSKALNEYWNNKYKQASDQKTSPKRKEQNAIFNSKLRSLKIKDPSHDQLLAISKEIQEESSEPFFLEKIIGEIRENKEEGLLSQNLKLVVSDYVNLHQHEIKAGVASSDFDISKVKGQVHKGCSQLVAAVEETKNKIQNDEIIEKFKIFYPDKMIDKSSNKLGEEKSISKSIQTFSNKLSMIEPMEYQKDILYCRKYNKIKERSEQFSKDERLRGLIANLSLLKDTDLPRAVGLSSGDDGAEAALVQNKIDELEEKIKKIYNIDDKRLSNIYNSFKIWQIDESKEVVRNNSGEAILQDRDFVAESKNFNISERISNRMQDTFNRPTYTGKHSPTLKSSGKVTSEVSSIISNSSSVNSNSSITSEYKTENLSQNTKSNDNYFRKNKPNSFNDNIQKTDEFVQNPYENGEADRVNFNNENFNTSSANEKRLESLRNIAESKERELKSRISSATENLELEKLKEELKKQSEELKRLSNLEKSGNSVEATSSLVPSRTPSSSARFRNVLGNSDSAYSPNSEEQGAKNIETTSSRGSSSSSYVAPVDQTSTSSAPAGQSSSSSNASSIDENSSVSGISLSSLKSFGDDVKIIENSSLGEIRPILVDSSFVELSEEEKRMRIEELLDKTPDDEVYLEFPDGKVLKFSKNGELKQKANKKKSITDSKLGEKSEEPKKRDVFSYESLKEIINKAKQ